eukprot:5175078-Prymnesium_polylepis.1
MSATGNIGRVQRNRTPWLLDPARNLWELGGADSSVYCMARRDIQSLDRETTNGLRGSDRGLGFDVGRQSLNEKRGRSTWVSGTRERASETARARD